MIDLPIRCFLLKSPHPICTSARSYSARRLIICNVRTRNSEGEAKDVMEREESTIPERFKHLSVEAPDPPVRWPWYFALIFCTFTWRAIFFELTRWSNALLAVTRSAFNVATGITRFLLAIVTLSFWRPITSLITFTESTLNMIWASYKSIIRHAPVPELIIILVLACIVLSVAEVAAPDCSRRQSPLLSVSGLVAFAAVRSYISEALFYAFIVGAYAYSRFVCKMDDVTSALPAASVLAAVGKPWIRVIAMFCFGVVAVGHHKKQKRDGKLDVKAGIAGVEVPAPLLGIALGIGIHIAAKWAGYRHLTWMIV